MQKRIMLFVLLAFGCFQSFAQVRGTTTSVTKALPFNHVFNNVTLDPNPVIGTNSRVQFVHTFSKNESPGIGLNTVLNLIGGDFNIPGWLTDLNSGVQFFCAGITPSFNVNGSIDAGGYYQVHSVGNSNIDVDYPVQVNIAYPQANTFACGETIRINTDYTILQPAATKLKVKPPFINQEIGPILNNLTLSASIGLDAWVGFGVSVPYPCESGICYHDICSNKLYFNQSLGFSLPLSLPNLPPLVNICESAFGPGANNATLLGCTWSSLLPFLHLGQQALDAYNSTHGSNYTFAEFPDYETVKIAPPDFAGGPTIPEMEGTFKDISNTGLNYSYLNNGRKLKVNGTKSSISTLSFDLVSLLDYAGVTTSKSLGGGRGSIDVGDIAPTFTVDQTLDFEYNPIVHLQVDLGAPMAYSVYNSNNTLDRTGSGQLVQLIAGQYIDAVIPQSQTSVLHASGAGNLDGVFSSVSNQEYFRSVQVAFGQVAMAGVIDFTLIDEEILKGKFGEKGILNHSFNLALPNSISLPAFDIDPENPIIDVTYLQTEDIQNIGGGKRNVVYKVGFTNEGDVALSNVQSTVNLAAAFATAMGYRVICINSDNLIVNNGFNGGADKNLLATGNELAIGQTKYLEMVVEVTPTVSPILGNGCFGTVDYTIASKASATSPIGTNIQSDYNQCTMQVTGADITTGVELGAEIINELQDFTIYGWDKVVFDKPFSTSYGNVGSYEDIVFKNVSKKDGPAVTIIGDLHVKDRLRLQGESDVIVDYVQITGSPEISNKSNLLPTGAISDNSGCVSSFIPLHLVMPANNSNAKIKVEEGSTLTLNPGVYKYVTVEENATLILKPGMYNIDSWKFKGENATVKYQTNNQNITIHVDKFQPHQRDNLRMMIDGPGKVSDVRVFIYGNQSGKFRNSFVQGIYCAPDAEIEFDRGSQLEGAVYAEKVNFKSGSVFKGIRYTIPLQVDPACQGSASFAAPLITQGSKETATESIVEIPVIEKKTNSKLAAYPNPVLNRLTITGLQYGKHHIIYMYDLQGRLLKQFQTSATLININMQDLHSGVYMLKINTEKEMFRIIKQ